MISALTLSHECLLAYKLEARLPTHVLRTQRIYLAT